MPLKCPCMCSKHDSSKPTTTKTDLNSKGFYEHMALTRTAYQTSAMFAQKRSSHAPTIKLMKNKFVLGSVNFQHSAPTRHQKSNDHEDAAPEKFEISVTPTELYSQLGAAFVFTCAHCLWFRICCSHSYRLLAKKGEALTHQLKKKKKKWKKKAIHPLKRVIIPF